MAKVIEIRAADLRRMARALERLYERCYRRGFQHGFVHLADNPAATGADVARWRMAEVTTRTASPPGCGGYVSTIRDRIAMESRGDDERALLRLLYGAPVPDAEPDEPTGDDAMPSALAILDELVCCLDDQDIKGVRRQANALRRALEPRDESGPPDVPLPIGVALWRICGEEANGSNGGESSLYVLTPSEVQIPDPQRALDEVQDHGHTFYRISSVELVGTLRSSRFDRLPDVNHHDRCADQTGHGLTPYDSYAIACLILDQCGVCPCVPAAAALDPPAGGPRP